MIDAKDLRLGNLLRFSDDGSLCKVMAVDGLGLSVDVIKTQEITWVELDAFEPIPLTPEILDKCGYLPNKGWYIKSLAMEEFNGKYLLSSEDNEYGFDYNNATEIKYLHQLQNLYFALTGEELNYKP